MKSLSLSQVKQRSLRGLSLLVMREGAIKIIAIAGQLVLVRLLVPEYFGVIAVVSFFMDMSDLFSDIGLVSSVIRSKTTLTQRVLSSLFWVKMTIQTLLAVFLLIAYSFLGWFFPALHAVDVAIFYVFIATLFTRPLRSFLYGLLERDLRYDAIPAVDISGLVVYFVVAIICALRGFGIWSLVWSVVAKDIVEIVLLEFFHLFIPSNHFHWSDVRPFLRFGIAVQGNTVLGALQQSTIPLLGGMLLSPTAIGLLDWSSNIASLPRSVTSSVGRISFASFSRIQEKTIVLNKAIQESLLLLLLIVSFFVLSSIFFGSDAILYVLGSQWSGASAVLPWLLLTEFFLAIVAVLQQAVIVRGKASSLATLSVSSLLLQWIAAFVLFHLFGFVGIAIGICLGMALQSIFCIFLVKRVGITLNLSAIFRPILLVGVFTIIMGWLLTFLPHSFLWLIVKGMFFGLAFMTATYVFAKSTLIRVAGMFRAYVFTAK